MKQELAEPVWKTGASSQRGVGSRRGALETPRLTREALGDRPKDPQASVLLADAGFRDPLAT